MDVTGRCESGVATRDILGRVSCNSVYKLDMVPVGDIVGYFEKD